ncbi:major facilitator superfamily domain-containing protein [Microdochium bolleyi]|uniref:Major facilitator superfamily domain-containing protein n=1 Tax=Microdochium bolleyi TaxID=196109 RepID=A0A136IX69_9PEZI|nr:major facilitator superfamily domain-containing protein [Microdochium bolleyi]
MPLFSRRKAGGDGPLADSSDGHPRKWNMGMLNDPNTIEVPGSVLLLASDRNEPLGLRNAPARRSHSSVATGWAQDVPPTPTPPPVDDKKKTQDGTIILEPQPDDSHNDPLNWPAWRRDCALLSLGLYCMVGGGITPILAAGFTDVAEEYGVAVHSVALTTGLYMMGLGLGSIIFSPTAILYGKRPIYLYSAILFIASTIWCALSPTFVSLILARIVQGIAVSPVECLPSATIAEIFFLHERAYRIGIYTLLLLGGKNLVPLVSAAIMQALDWRWVFWIVAMIVGFCLALLFFFVPETFWDRSPIPRKSGHHLKRPSFLSRRSTSKHIPQAAKKTVDESLPGNEKDHDASGAATRPTSRHKSAHVGFAPDTHDAEETHAAPAHSGAHVDATMPPTFGNIDIPERPGVSREHTEHSIVASPHQHDLESQSIRNSAPPSRGNTAGAAHDTESEKNSLSNFASATRGQLYTHDLRHAPPKSFKQQLQIHNGRLNQDRWWRVCVRPFILFAYPAVLWSSVIYACSVGWLIVISESVAIVFREGRYKFDAMQTGLVYLSPFIGGVLGTAVAGKVSDIVVKAMSRRNGGLYEPEFRLVMAFPIAVTTVMGLIGFGWTASAESPYVPIVFFGIVSFGCSLGSTTSITFCVDSYRQYAGEALVTLNFSKNVLHGLVFSLFVAEWLTHDGPKTVYMWIGIIQLIFCLFSIPMYIYGKRARMWTVRMNLMEKF